MAKGKKRKKISDQWISNVSENVKAISSGCATCNFRKEISPSWRFTLINKHEIFPFPVEAKAINEIVSNLAYHESKSLGTLRGDRSNPYAVYELEKIKEQLDKDVLQLMQENYPDFSELHRFKVGYKSRVYALSKERGVFILLFWDPDHLIYKVER